MVRHVCGFLFALLMFCLGLPRPAAAQWAVIDAPAIIQLVQEVETMQQQVQTARDQLAQSEQALRTMTGDRGMASLQSGARRNYLPSNWSELSAAGRGGSAAYPGLASDVRLALAANAVLSRPQFATLSAADQRQITAARQASALQQAVAQQALNNVSGRFAVMQNLLAAIATAGDQKSILDLQARISAEVGMLQNEQTKLQVLSQATGAQDSVDREQQREHIVEAHGVFETRFQPAP